MNGGESGNKNGNFKVEITHSLLKNKRGKWFRAAPTVHFRTGDVT